MADTWQKSGIEYIVKDSTRTGVAGVQKSLQTLEKTAQGVSKMLGTALAVGVGYVGISKLVSGYQEVAQSISDTAKAADILQISTESMSGLKYVAEQSEVAGASMVTFLERLTRFGAEAAQGTEAARIGLQQLGLSAKELSETSPDQAIRKLADAFQTIPNASDQMRLAFDIFGRGGAEMLKVLRLGSAGIDEMMVRGQKLGGVLTEVDAALAHQAEVALKELRTIKKAIQDQLVVQVAPYIAALAGRLADAAAAGGGFGETVTSAMESVAVAAGKVLDILIKIENIKNSVALRAYDAAFKKDVFDTTKEVYADQMKREGKQPWSLLGKGGVRYENRWAQAEEIVRKDRTPAYEAGRAPLVQEASNAEQTKTYFAQLRQRAQGIREQAETEARIKEYGRSPMAVSNPAGVMPTEQEIKDAEQAIQEEERAVRRAAEGMQRLRDRVSEMDAATETEIEVVRRAGDAHGKLGEIVRYEMTVREAYGDSVDEVTRRLENHRRALELLSRVEFSNRSLDDLGQTLTDIAFDFKNASQYAEQFFNTLARRATNEFIMQPFMDAIKPGVASLFAGGGRQSYGSLDTSVGSNYQAQSDFYGYSAEVHHAGGGVGDAGQTRYLPVGAADRYLASNERLIVARVGEEVLTEQESRRQRVAVYHGGGIVGGSAEAASVPASGGAAGRPDKVDVRISNPPGSPLEATGAQISFDGPTMIVGVILDNIRRGGVMRDQIRMTARGG